MEYLEQIHAKYLQHSLSRAIALGDDIADEVLAQTADELLGNTASNVVRLGAADPFKRRLLLSQHANLGTLAHELIHFEQLLVRGLWGLPNNAANRAMINNLRPGLEESVERVLTHWGFGRGFSL